MHTTHTIENLRAALRKFDMKITGGCLCGCITFEINSPFLAFTHCYCKRCRKASGSGRASVLISLAHQLNWLDGAEYIKRWDLPTAASFATSFCTNCGCPLPRFTRDKKYAVIPAGSLNGDPLVVPECHEHWASRADWISLEELCLPVFDQHAP